MNSRILKLWDEHPLALIAEIAVFAAFLLSLYMVANIEGIASGWAMLPHILCSTVVVVLVARHRLLKRPAMYRSSFDLTVAVLFLYFIANVYYSEIRSVSWQTAALYLDGFAAYLMGRMMFYHRVRGFALVLVAGLGLAWLGMTMNAHQARQQESALHKQATELLQAPPAGMTPDDARAASDMLFEQAEQQDRVALHYGPIRNAYFLFLAFWVLSLPFLWLEKPTRLAFVVYSAGMFGLYAFYALGRMAWAFSGGESSEDIIERNDRFESLRTAVHIIKSYPVMGSGLGTFPEIFDAYRLTPTARFDTGFNSYVYGAVETGMLGVLILVYFLVRFPVHVLRRWKMFPNPRLRLAVTVHLIFLILFAVQAAHDSDLFNPAVWFPFWAIIGTFVSLVMVRDPIRVFESLLPQGRTLDPQAIHRRNMYAGSTGRFGRTPLAKLPRPKLSIFRRLGVTQFLITGAFTAVFLAVTALQLAPYLAQRLATPPAGAKDAKATIAQRKELLASEEYGKSLVSAIRVFPLDSRVWSARAAHFDARVTDPLEIYDYSDRIEDSYKKAIARNPYRPELYEKLYFLYREVNRQGDALDIIKEGVQTNPQQLLLRLLLVQELERVGNYPLATYHVKLALHNIAPDRSELYLRLAELYEIQGLVDDAKLYYLYAKQVVNDNAATEARLKRLATNLGL